MYKLLNESEITELTLAGYIQRVWEGLRVLILAILISEIFMFFTMAKFDSELISTWMPDRWLFDFNYFKRHVIIPTILNCSVYSVLYVVHKYKKQILKSQICLTLFLVFIASVYVFGHYGMFYLSVAFIFPVLLVSPFGEHISIVTAASVVLLTFINFRYQQNVKHDYFNMFVLTTNLCLEAMAWIISKSLKRFYSQLVTRNFEISRQANVDALTGLLNRNAFDSRKADTSNIRSLAFIDVDKFKGINDTYLHSTGDIILKTVADCLKQVDSYSEGTYRFGGDEFIVFANCSSTELAKLLKAAKEDFKRTVQHNLSIKSTLSIGVQSYDGSDLAEVIGNADKSMYTAKANGRDTITCEGEII